MDDAYGQHFYMSVLYHGIIDYIFGSTKWILLGRPKTVQHQYLLRRGDPYQ